MSQAERYHVRTTRSGRRLTPSPRSCIDEVHVATLPVRTTTHRHLLYRTPRLPNGGSLTAPANRPNAGRNPSNFPIDPILRTTVVACHATVSRQTEAIWDTNAHLHPAAGFRWLAKPPGASSLQSSRSKPRPRVERADHSKANENTYARGHAGDRMSMTRQASQCPHWAYVTPRPFIESASP